MNSPTPGFLAHEQADGYFCVDRLSPCSVHVLMKKHQEETEKPYEVLVALHVQSEVVVLSRLFFVTQQEAKLKFDHLLHFYQST